jgi:hypothetical protein
VAWSRTGANELLPSRLPLIRASGASRAPGRHAEMARQGLSSNFHATFSFRPGDAQPRDADTRAAWLFMLMSARPGIVDAAASKLRNGKLYYILTSPSPLCMNATNRLASEISGRTVDPSGDFIIAGGAAKPPLSVIAIIPRHTASHLTRLVLPSALIICISACWHQQTLSERAHGRAEY